MDGYSPTPTPPGSCWLHNLRLEDSGWALLLVDKHFLKPVRESLPEAVGWPLRTAGTLCLQGLGEGKSLSQLCM